MASALPRRATAGRRHVEEEEELNENQNNLITHFPSPLSLARSPLISIPNPSQSPIARSPRITTPKSAVSRSLSRRFSDVSPLSEPRGSTRCSRRTLDSNNNPNPHRKSDTAEEIVETPFFELDEDPSFWTDHNVQVLIRVRPINSSESALNGQKRCLTQESSQSLTYTVNPETRFTFDHVASESISQEKLFRVVGVPMVENCMSGYNGCMFAYGQTGSGKTYTMMGELREIEKNPSEDRGITPRVFEYLFARIKEEEERRSDEKLKYSCKCSFLEIYNEQITDLLEPSSTNLQLREDVKKGVYVENLQEYEVSCVKDVMELLLQGCANRKMAGTNMNSESSRSHSVFTCVIESRWERDSMSHLRFARLNLVDLAGSERQKSSGAEGERLKEAANINRSLSTLGLVIMTLVDVANRKNRHIPYRDSRLTFLLQDSLGGNSKTSIVATVSPSICSSNETLSTLKFAQRAKLIQNNAKVNEDASGDVLALQRQIQELKDELTGLKSHQNNPNNLLYSLSSFQSVNPEDRDLLNQKVNSLETALAASLRRERKAEAEIKRLEAELKHVGRLVHLMEDDAQRMREKLKLRDEKIRRLELLADDLICSDGYLMEENFALNKEIKLLQEQTDKNPDLSKFALENMKLLEQLKTVENYSKLGEREVLLTDLALLRNHFLNILDGKYAPNNTQSPEILTDQTDFETKTAANVHGLETLDMTNPQPAINCTQNNAKELDREIELENHILALTEENTKLRGTVISRDAEWEISIVDLTRFLLDGCDSLEQATESIDKIVGSFPEREFTWVNGQVERAMRVSLERERLIHELKMKLEDARRIERELKGKLDCLRGATLAMTELQERDSDESHKEILNLKKFLCEKESWDVERKEINLLERDNLVDMAQNIEDKSKHTMNLLREFEKAQETMEEAEEVLSLLLTATETARLERDSLLASNSSNLEEISNLVSSIEDYFCKVKEFITVEMGGFHSDVMFLGQELRKYIENLRSFFANLPLRREIERKNEIVKGLFFDLSLLQESTSQKRDWREEYEVEIRAKDALIEQMSTTQKFLEAELSSARTELERTGDLCSLLKREKSELEGLLEENSKVIDVLEREILSMDTIVEREYIEKVEREVERMGQERERLERERADLKASLETALALVEEKEAIAVEAREAAETSKIYAEEREEEVKILEHSVGELEATINVLEGKVYDLKEEVESYHLIKKDLELEIEELSYKINLLENTGPDTELYHLPRNLDDRIIELHKAQKHIKDLEIELQYREEEIKQYRDHITELVLHSEAQSSLFQEKFKVLEQMVSSTKFKASSNSNNTESITEKTGMPSVRTRGSSSPFKCISSIVHQMNSEKEHELSIARNRIQELESLAHSKQQEVCQLTARLATVDTMTHDVIRDLLGVKFDIENFANLVDEEQIEKLLVKSHQQVEESKIKDEEILDLKMQIDRLLQERESLIEEINERKSEIFESQMVIEELEQHEQALLAENKILKMDKASHQRKIEEMSQKLESFLVSNNAIGDQIKQSERNEGSSRNNELRKRIAQSDKLLSHYWK